VQNAEAPRFEVAACLLSKIRSSKHRTGTINELFAGVGSRIRRVRLDPDAHSDFLTSEPTRS
jgi:hypothetical protein